MVNRSLYVEDGIVNDSDPCEVHVRVKLLLSVFLFCHSHSVALQ